MDKKLNHDTIDELAVTGAYMESDFGAVMTLEEYKGTLASKVKLTNTNWLILHTKEVKLIKDGVRFILDFGSAIDVYKDGTAQKYDKLGRKKGKQRSGDRPRIVLPSCKSCSSMSLERLMLLGYSIRFNQIPAQIDHLHANVKDLSASNKTRAELKLHTGLSISLENLEWCYDFENTAHQQTVRLIYKKTGLNVRVPAKDWLVRQLAREDNKDLLLYYITKMGYVI